MKIVLLRFKRGQVNKCATHSLLSRIKWKVRRASCVGQQQTESNHPPIVCAGRSCGLCREVAGYRGQITGPLEFMVGSSPRRRQSLQRSRASATPSKRNSIRHAIQRRGSFVNPLSAWPTTVLKPTTYREPCYRNMSFPLPSILLELGNNAQVTDGPDKPGRAFTKCIRKRRCKSSHRAR